MEFRGYVIGAILLLALLAITTAMGAGIGFAFSLLSDSAPARIIGICLGSFFGFLFGAGMCQEAIRFTAATLADRENKKNSASNEA